MKLNKTTALLIIDVQYGLDDPSLPKRNNPDAEQQMARLLTKWRENGWPVYHVQHLSTSPNSPLQPHLPGVEIKAEVKPLPHEPLFQKNVNSAFIGTDLEAQLKANGHLTLVVVGLTTQHCVSTSVRMAGNLGFTVYLVADATAAQAQTGLDGTVYAAQHVHNVELALLSGEFATIVSAKEILAVV